MIEMKKKTKALHGRQTIRRVFCLFLAILVVSSCLSAGAAEYGTEPEIKAEGAILYERNSGQIIYEKNPDKKLYPASTTKIMTALLLLEQGNLDEKVTVSAEAMNAVPSGSSLAGLKAGEELTMYELLICLLVPSGNDAANAVAVAVGGSISSFVEMMNERAKLLGCENTHFVNPHGFHDDDHYTSASDLLKITLAALEYPIFEEVCGMAQATIPATNKSEERIFNNTNYMISNAETSGYLYPACTGGKTGSTTPAGRCLVAFAKKDDTRLISVMLKSTTEYSASGIRQIRSFLDTADLFDWAFDNFKWFSLISKEDPVAEVKVTLSQDKDYVVLCPQTEYSTYLYRNTNPDEIYSKEITVADSVEAPVKKGDELGTLTILLDGKPKQTIKLLATEDVERSPLLFFLQQVQEILHKSWVKWMFLGLILAIVVYILLKIRRSLSRKKQNQPRKKNTGSKTLR